MKSLFASKTFWLGALTLTISVLGFLAGEELIKDNPKLSSYIGLAIGILTIVNRFFTKEPVTMKMPNKKLMIIGFLTASLFATWYVAQADACQQIFQRMRANRQQRIQQRNYIQSVPMVQQQTCVNGECFPTYTTTTYAPTYVPAPAPAPAPAQVTQVIPQSTPVPSVAEIAEVRGDQNGFRRNLIKAIIKARKAGDISAREAVRLRTATLSPAFMERAQDLAVMQMAFSGTESSDALPRTETGAIDVASIDWDAFASFLERLVPLLLQIFSAFGIG